MILNKKAGIWAFNFLISIAIIAILLFSFFMIMSVLKPGEIKQVRAEIVEIRGQSDLINIFRMPINDKILADFSLLDCDVIFSELDSFYGSDAAYVLTSGKVIKCKKGDIGASPETIELLLPDYNSRSTKVVLKVNHEIVKK